MESKTDVKTLTLKKTLTVDGLKVLFFSGRSEKTTIRIAVVLGREKKAFIKTGIKVTELKQTHCYSTTMNCSEDLGKIIAYVFSKPNEKTPIKDVFQLYVPIGKSIKNSKMQWLHLD